MLMLETSCTHDSSCALSLSAVSILESSNGHKPWPLLAPLPHAVFLCVLPLLVRGQVCWFLVCKLDTLLVFGPGTLIVPPGLAVGSTPCDLVQCHNNVVISFNVTTPLNLFLPGEPLAVRLFSCQWSFDAWCSLATERVVCESPHPRTDTYSFL